MSVYVRQATYLSSDALDSVGDVLMHGFADDRLMQISSGESPVALRAILRRRAELAMSHGGLYLARSGGSEGEGEAEDVAADAGAGKGKGIVGVMILDPPGVESPNGLSGEADDARFAKVSPQVDQWARETLGPFLHTLVLRSLNLGPSGQTDSLYIAFLAVDPSTRGMGVGRKLVERALALADEKGVQMALVTPTEMNLNIYDRLGFVLAIKDEVASPHANEAKVTFWGMCRAPGTKAQSQSQAQAQGQQTLQVQP